MAGRRDSFRIASQRSGGQDLATHLLNEYDNDIAEVAEVRGAIAADLHGAFKEWEVQAAALTRCHKYLYSLSVNPDPAQGPLSRDQYRDYIGRVEQSLGLAGQPRAIVYHTKFGREHCHVIWSRIDAENEKAVHLAFDREKLMDVTRGFARDHHLALPPGYDRTRGNDPITFYEKEQERQTGFAKADHMAAVTEAWHLSDSGPAFVQALAERGYLLATGKRPYVLVDLYGHTNALAKLIDDKTVRTKDLRAFLEKDFPPESLPSVDEAKALVARHKSQSERALSKDKVPSQREALVHAQTERRSGLEAKRTALGAAHQRERQTLHERLASEIRQLRSRQRAAVEQTKADRASRRPNGLAGFLGRVTGVERITKILRRREDYRSRLYEREQLLSLRISAGRQNEALQRRQATQAAEVERQISALKRVDRRELASLLKDQRAVERSAERRGRSLPGVEGVQRQHQHQARDVQQDFADAAKDRAGNPDQRSDDRSLGQQPDVVQVAEPKKGPDRGDR